jgi:hypothetical protein
VRVAAAGLPCCTSSLNGLVSSLYLMSLASTFALSLASAFACAFASTFDVSGYICVYCTLAFDDASLLASIASMLRTCTLHGDGVGG